jgi:diguanylate cyclase
MRRDPARTQALAETALHQIKGLGLPADPESYALWYVYAAGTMPELNNKIDQLIADNAASVTEFDRLYDNYLSPTQLLDHADRIGSVLFEQIEHITDLIEASVGSSDSLEMHLATAGQELRRTVDRETIRAVVETLIKSIKEMEERACASHTALQSSHQVIQALKQNLKQTREEANTDPVTLLCNRRQFDRVLNRAVETANDKSSRLSLLMIDVDDFKRFNDVHGHQMGDEVLRLLGATLKEATNGSGLAARLGGDEFAVILRDNELSEAHKRAETIRRSIMEREVQRRATKERLGRITISIGVAQYQPPERASALLDRADRHLLIAKEQGRNRVA